MSADGRNLLLTSLYIFTSFFVILGSGEIFGLMTTGESSSSILIGLGGSILLPTHESELSVKNYESDLKESVSGAT